MSFYRGSCAGTIFVFLNAGLFLITEYFYTVVLLPQVKDLSTSSTTGSTWWLKMRRRQVLSSVQTMRITGCLMNCLHKSCLLMTSQTLGVGKSFLRDRLFVREEQLTSVLNSKA